MNIIKCVLAFILIFIFIQNVSATTYTPVTNSSTLQASNLTINNTTSTAYVLLSSFYLPENISGVINITFDHKCSSAAGGCSYSQLRLDGVNIGSEYAAVVSTYNTITQNITVTAGTNNRIELYGKKVLGTHSVQNFKVSYSYTYPSNPETDTTHNYSNYTTWLIPGAPYVGSIVNVSIIPRVNKSSPYDINTTGLIGWWHLDDNLTDVSGRNHNGTIVGTGITYNIGEFNNGTSFDGNGYINTSNVTDFDFAATEQFTIITWLKSNGIVGAEMVLGNMNTSAYGLQWYYLNDTGQDALKVDFLCNGGSSTLSFDHSYNSQKLSDSIWHQYILMYNGSGGLNYYYDAKLVTNITKTSSASGICKSTLPLFIGSRPLDSGVKWKEQMDEVQIYNRTLNQSEINSTYYVKPSNLRVKTDSGTGDWSSGWNNYTPITGGDSPININTGGIFSNVLIDVPSTYNQSGINISDFQRLAWFNITSTQTASKLYFISPTKVNASETWLQNSTSIYIQTTDTFNNAPILTIRNGKSAEVRITNYTMSSINSTTYSYNFTNLDDGDYYYNVTANLSINGIVTTPTYYTTIDFDFWWDWATPASVYMHQLPSGQYIYNMSWNVSGATFIEREFLGFGNPDHITHATLKSCYNAGTGIYRPDTSCNGGETATNLIDISTQWHPYLTPLYQYINATGYYGLFSNRSIPAGYSINKTLGWVRYGEGKQENSVCLNNTKIKFCVDTQFGGAIDYISEANSTKNFVVRDSIGRLVQSAYYELPWGVTTWDEFLLQYNGSWYNSGHWGFNPTLAGDAYEHPPTNTTYTYDSTNKTITIYVYGSREWNPSDSNHVNSDLNLISTYSLDGESSYIIMNFTYIHEGYVTHQSWGKDAPALHMINDFQNATYRNITSGIVDIPDGVTDYNIPTGNGVWVGAFNSTNFGLGLWHASRPQFVVSDFTDVGTYGEWDAPTMKLSASPNSQISAYGEAGYTGSNIAWLYVGNFTDMDTFFSGLEFTIEFDPITPINQTITDNNINIQVNATDTAIIETANLYWTNSTGTYNLTMNVSELGDHASLNMTGLSNYNYSYYVSSYATTGAMANTSYVWTDIITPLYIPPIPITLANTTGNFWINHTWSAGSGNITDSYNVSQNGTWTNSSLTYNNVTIPAHGWSNISVYSYNISSSGSLNATPISMNTQLSNNAPTISNITTTYNLNEGDSLYIDANYADLDGDSVTFGDNSSEWNINSGTGVVSWVTVDGNQGTYYYQINVTDNYSAVAYYNFTVIVADSTPSVISNLANTTGNFWINWTYTSGQRVSDYDIWIDDVDVGADTTNLYYNGTYAAHASKTISVRSHNHSLNVYSAWINQTTTIPNNVPTQNAIGNKNTNEGQEVTVTITSTDADTDVLTYGTNATKGSLVGNVWTWTPDYTESGVYTWYFNTTDGYGGLDTETITVTVTDVPQPSMPPSPINIGYTNASTWVNHTWEAGIGNITNSYNVSVNGIWYNGTTNTYYLHNVGWNSWSNISVYAWNSTGSGLLNQTPISQSFKTPIQPPDIPAINYYINNKTGDATLDITINQFNGVLYSAGSNQSIDTWTWTTATKVGGDGTTNSTASKYYDTLGDTTVTVVGNNATNGSTNTIIWTVHTVNDGSGEGTDWDWAKGYVKYPNGTAISGVLVSVNTTPAHTDTTDAFGYFEFDYYFIHNTPQTFTGTKAGFVTNATSFPFSGGYFQWANLTMNVTPPIPPPPPQNNTVYTIHYEYGCTNASGFITPQIGTIFDFNIIVIIIAVMIVLVAFVTERGLMGIVVAAIFLIIMPSFLPTIISSVQGIDTTPPACSNAYQNLNVSGLEDTWVVLSHNDIKNGTQSMYNSTYIGISGVDYEMDYGGGRVKPLSTGAFNFVP